MLGNLGSLTPIMHLTICPEAILRSAFMLLTQDNMKPVAQQGIKSLATEILSSLVTIRAFFQSLIFVGPLGEYLNWSYVIYL